MAEPFLISNVACIQVLLKGLLLLPALVFFIPGYIFVNNQYDYNWNRSCTFWISNSEQDIIFEDSYCMDRAVGAIFICFGALFVMIMFAGFYFVSDIKANNIKQSTLTGDV